MLFQNFMASANPPKVGTRAFLTRFGILPSSYNTQKTSGERGDQFLKFKNMNADSSRYPHSPRPIEGGKPQYFCPRTDGSNIARPPGPQGHGWAEPGGPTGTRTNNPSAPEPSRPPNPDAQFHSQPAAERSLTEVD